MSLFAQGDASLKEGLSAQEQAAVCAKIESLTGVFHTYASPQRPGVIGFAFSGNPGTLEEIRKIPGVVDARFAPNPFRPGG